MFKNIKSLLAGGLLVVALTVGGASLVQAVPAPAKIVADAASDAAEAAAKKKEEETTKHNKSEVTKGIDAIGGAETENNVTLETFVTNIINVLLFVVGAVAVIVIIVGGISYVVSAGDPAKVKKAKDTILYAIVGLVVAILAFAIVKFVTDNL